MVASLRVILKTDDKKEEKNKVIKNPCEFVYSELANIWVQQKENDGRVCLLNRGCVRNAGVPACMNVCICLSAHCSRLSACVEV